MDDEDYFEIMTELLTVKDKPAFRFVLNKNNFKIVGAWTANCKYISRADFNEDMETLAKEKESEEHDKNFHKEFNLEGGGENVR